MSEETSFLVQRVNRPDPDCLELLVRGPHDATLGDESLQPIYEQLMKHYQQTEANKICIDIRCRCSGFALGSIAEKVSDVESVSELHLQVQGHEIADPVLLNYVGKLTKLQLVQVRVLDDIRIYEKNPLTVIAKGVTFDGDAEFLSNIKLADFGACTFKGQLFLHGKVEKLKVINCKLVDVRLAPYFMGQATYVAGEEDLQTFTGSSLKGTVSIEGMKSSPPCTIDFRGVEFESGSKLRMNASDVAIDLRGVTLRSGCEMLFERNAARVFDLRLMNISSGARIGFRNQPLNELLTAGTNLAQFSFSLVTFAAKKARAYLADDPSRTHLPIEYKATQGSPDATVPKIFGTDVPEAQVLESYRQLIGYFDSARDFRTAESLHFSEMALAQYVSRNELSRRFGFFGGILSWLSFHNFYRLFAGYGTSVFRSGIWLAIFLLFVFPLFFLVVGFNVNSGSTTNRGSEYIGFSTLVCTSTNSCIAQLPSLANAYFTATTYTILLAGLQKDDMIYPANKWGLFGKAVVAPISLSQLALFIIALKRRFRRGAT